ncbi:MAG: N-acetylmuramoyl-L-alanine amidase [Leptospirales bacterium]|nr:N-acetylmuramoyl-L-alanine amidase [Leptospirales bacterium]
MTGRLLFAFLLIVSCAALSPLGSENGIPVYRVVVDPGHGGANGRGNDDKWDPVTRQYLSPFLYGAGYRGYREHVIVLDLGKRVQRYLDLTQTESGWREFQSILQRFSRQSRFQRVIFETSMSRTDNFATHRYRSGEDRNAPFRLYDFPDADGRIQPGRISFINSRQPELVLSLHMNPAGPNHPGGMAAVLTPGYATFDMLRAIHLGQRPLADFKQSPWYGTWLVTDPGWSQWEAARADTWVYFNGYRTLRDGSRIDSRKNRGLRQNMVQWRYAQPPGWEKLYEPNQPGPYAHSFADFRPTGVFWEREQAQAEAWRREGGVMGFGGDNYLASDELMRFVQFAVRAQLPPARRARAMGRLAPPYVSAYSMPELINAINAYLEIGYIDVRRDRDLLMGKREEVARALAAGVYSLFVGLEIDRAAAASPYYPRGQALDFQRYRELPGGNYFQSVVD